MVTTCIDLVYHTVLLHEQNAEENLCQGGFGSAVLEALIDKGINNIKVKRIGIKDTFVEHGPRNILRSKYGIDADSIVDAAMALMTTDFK